MASALRPYWKGFLSFGLVNVPVRLFTTSASGTSDIKLNQIHRGCSARVNYKKCCPIHGDLKQEDIVSGYEFAEGQYVLFDPAEEHAVDGASLPSRSKWSAYEGMKLAGFPRFVVRRGVVCLRDGEVSVDGGGLPLELEPPRSVEWK